MATVVERGREAFERQAWDACYELLSAAAAEAPLEADDLERLAVAAYLVGNDDDSVQAWERAHLECLRIDDADRAARCAFWLGLALLLRGQMAPAGGWLARASRLVEDAGDDCLARGYLLVPAALEALDKGDFASSYAMASAAGEIAERFDDKDLLAFSWIGRAEASIALGETARGVALLDEVMVTITTGEVSPIPAGIVYCAVIGACMEVFDVRRAAEWTEALSRWCAAQPSLVPYRGQCLVHRSQILQAHGEWSEAVAEAERAREWLSRPPHPAMGEALYQLGELHRLRGELAAAEDAYRRASEHGRQPAPGLALLRLAEGRVETAAAAIRRLVEEGDRDLARPTMLAAYVEIMLAAGDVEAARAAADELTKTAGNMDAPVLRAMGAYAAACVLLAEGEPAAALPPLREACANWRRLGMPYEEARARTAIGLACRAVGDEDAATLELEAARLAFERLGAPPDLAHVADLLGTPPAKGTDPLTGREREVLRLVAAGKTNREIGAALVISEHTVARHVQNIFTKLGLSSRAAATAYAYEHGVI